VGRVENPSHTDSASYIGGVPPPVDPPPVDPPPLGSLPPPPGHRFETLCAAVDAESFTVSTTRLITLGLRGCGGAGFFAAGFFAATFFGAGFFGAGFRAFAGARRLAGAFFAARLAEVFLPPFLAAFFDRFFAFEDLPEGFFFEEDFLAAMRFSPSPDVSGGFSWQSRCTVEFSSTCRECHARDQRHDGRLQWQSPSSWPWSS
jgi:hypothetical protein